MKRLLLGLILGVLISAVAAKAAPMDSQPVRVIILDAALAHHQDPALMDRVAWCEHRYQTDNLYQLATPGKATEFWDWEIHQGFTDHRLDDPARQANFVADQLNLGALSAWYPSRACWGYLIGDPG